MRTTIDIDEDLRRRLRNLADERGEKGYSTLVNEALREYLDNREVRKKKLSRALELEGSIDESEADNLTTRIEEIWKSWDL